MLSRVLFYIGTAFYFVCSAKGAVIGWRYCWVQVISEQSELAAVANIKCIASRLPANLPPKDQPEMIFTPMNALKLFSWITVYLWVAKYYIGCNLSFDLLMYDFCISWHPLLISFNNVAAARSSYSCTCRQTTTPLLELTLALIIRPRGNVCEEAMSCLSVLSASFLLFFSTVLYNLVRSVFV